MLGRFGTNLFHIADCVSVSTFCHFVNHLWLVLESSPFENLWQINRLSWKFVQYGRIHFTLKKIKNKLISTKNRVIISLVGPLETGKLQLIPIWRKNRTFHSKFDKIDFFINIPNLFTIYAKGNRKSRVCAWSKLWVYWFDKKQRYKVLVNFWRLLWRDLQFRGFFEIAIAGRHRCLSTIYIKRNLFHQSKLGRNLELQNTHYIRFKSARNVTHVTTLSIQLGLGSELVD